MRSGDLWKCSFFWCSLAFCPHEKLIFRSLKTELFEKSDGIPFLHFITLRFWCDTQKWETPSHYQSTPLVIGDQWEFTTCEVPFSITTSGKWPWLLLTLCFLFEDLVLEKNAEFAAVSVSTNKAFTRHDMLQIVPLSAEPHENFLASCSTGCPRFLPVHFCMRRAWGVDACSIQLWVRNHNAAWLEVWALLR